MQYAVVNDVRTEAFPGGKGICPICSADTIAKCGTRIVHHWGMPTGRIAIRDGKTKHLGTENGRICFTQIAGKFRILRQTVRSIGPT
jgi:hypothetical protein